MRTLDTVPAGRASQQVERRQDSTPNGSVVFIITSALFALFVVANEIAAEGWTSACLAVSLGVVLGAVIARVAYRRSDLSGRPTTASSSSSPIATGDREIIKERRRS